MKDKAKTRAQLIDELHDLRRQLAHFRASESRHEEIEEALRESEGRLRNMVQQAGEGIFVYDLEGRLIDVNKRAHEYLGYERDELLELSFMEVEKSLTAERVRELWREMSLGTPVSLEGILRRKDGSIFPAEFRLSLLTHNGDPIVLAMARDITQRKRAESLLAAERQRLFSVLEKLPVAVCLQARDHSIPYANCSFRQLFGNPEGRFCYEVFRHGKIPCDPCRAFQVFETGLPQQGEYRDASGRVLEVYDSSFRDHDGSILILEVAVDITERRLAEEALQESKAHLSATIESIPFEFWAVGPDGFYTMQNRPCREHYGDIIGNRPEDVCPSKNILAVWQSNNRRALAGELVKGEVKYRFGDEERFYYNVVAPIRDHHRTRGILGINVDITERKQLEAALTRVNEELESLVDERTGELNAKTRRLEEFNAALKVLLKQREEDRQELEESILFNVKSLIAPYLEKLRKCSLSEDQLTYLTILESHIDELTAPFTKRLSQKYLGLTSLEIQAANLIKEGKTTKEIAETLHVSENTVSSHRFHIRTKLGLRNKKINLSSYLRSLAKQ